MNSKRKDPLRFIFNPPLPCFLQVGEMNNESMSGHTTEAVLLDLSHNGCKIESETSFHANDQTINMMITFQLSDSIQLKGQVKWHVKKWNSYAYGVRFFDHTPQYITDQLKLYVKKLRNDLPSSMSKL